MIKIHLVGDVMVGRSFNDTFRVNPKYNIWGNTINIFNNSDLVIANLETTLTDSTKLYPSKVFNFKLSPKYAHTLKDANIGHVNIANNHILDYQDQGLTDTVNTLDSLGLTYSGAGINLSSASKTIYKNIKGIVIGIYSLSDHYDYWKATRYTNGINYVDVDNPDPRILLDISTARINCDVLIISIHHGPNYVNEIAENTRKFFHSLIDAGVDIIHGHSAHHVTDFEKYSGGYIFYSLGDFIDDYAVDSYYRNDLSIIVEIEVSTESKRINHIHVHKTRITIQTIGGILYPQVNTYANPTIWK